MKRLTCKETLRYVSSFSVGTLHGMINNALLSMLLYNGKYNVECYSPKSAYPTLRAGLDECNVIKWHHLFINGGSGHVSMLFRYLLSAFYNVLILLRSNKDDILFYNFNNVFSLKLIDWINRFLKRSIVICCHGEMEYLANAKKHSRLYKRLMIKLTCGYFNLKREPATGIKFIVFGDVIKDNLRRYVSDKLFKRIYSLDHPVIPDKDINVKSQCNDLDVINIGLVGIINKYKGADRFPHIAERLRDNRRLSFHAIGHFQCDPNPFVKAGIIVPEDTSKPLSEIEFKKKIENLDYILFLYPADTYRLIASGAILDCIRFKRPVIGIRTDYFDYLFKKFGEFGYLAKDIDELYEILRKVDDLKVDFSYDKIADKLSPGFLSERLMQIINRDSG